ncbi:transposase [Acetobacter senegalensis]|uniref:Transposase n=1 Tax=Acetobacter senegalensis TaxID=446692 RepID=A0A252EEZ0_9PROT|nr:transposase [Acetobacter senegalensis]
MPPVVIGGGGKQPVFFGVEERLARLSGLGDQLEAFSRTVDFEVFRPDLN